MSELENAIELPERVITPHRGLDAFREAVAASIRNYDHARVLGWRMFVRDTSAQFRQSLLGYIWLFLPALATATVWIFLTGQDLVAIDTENVPYPLFVMTGTILWTAFNMSVTQMQGVVNEARSVLSKINFPHEALVYAAVLKSCLNAFVPILILIPVVLWYGIPPSPSQLVFLCGVLSLILLGSAIGLVLVPVAALYSDVGRGIQLALRFGFFVTPVIFPLPETGSSRSLLILNPVTGPLVTARHFLIGSESSLLGIATMTFLLSAIVAATAGVVFKVVMPQIIERLNA